MGNSISLPSWVPDQGTRINSARGQPSSCPRGTFIFGDVDDRLSGMRKYHLQLELVSLSVLNVIRKALRIHVHVHVHTHVYM